MQESNKTCRQKISWRTEHSLSVIKILDKLLGSVGHNSVNYLVSDFISK